MIHLWWWFVHVTGSDSTFPYGHFSFYNFVSGFGSDLGEYVIVGAAVGGLLAFLHKHNCQVHGCKRMGWRCTNAGHFVCKKHHPEDHKALTAEAVAYAHEQATPVLHKVEK